MALLKLHDPQSSAAALELELSMNMSARRLKYRELPGRVERETFHGFREW